MTVKGKRIFKGVVGLVMIWGVGYWSLWSAPSRTSQTQVFTIATGTVDEGVVASRLKDGGFIRSVGAFKLILLNNGKKIQPGGYQIGRNLNVGKLVDKLTSPPDLVWVVIPEGLRKEEIGERWGKALNWDEKQLHDWTYIYTAMDYDHVEGVYFPDTYLIPVKESGLEVANRMRRRFDEQFAPYLSQALKQNIKWTTVLKLASIIQREAGGKNDMPLIAGILWNRLTQNIKLEVDATVQYARDNKEELTTGFWKPIKSADKQIDSKYNTYKYAGLPPFPIANPGLAAIKAVLNPTETDCLFYLHDADRQIHCAATYEEHKENIAKYL